MQPAPAYPIAPAHAQRVDFNRFRAMIERQPLDAPVMFEHYIEKPHSWTALHGHEVPDGQPPVGWMINAAKAHAALGYDTWHCALGYFGAKGAMFTLPARAQDHSRGLFSGGGITNRQDAEGWTWPDIHRDDHLTALNAVQAASPAGMKCLVGAQGGLYDTLVELFGFERLCHTLADDYELVEFVAEQIATHSIAFLEKVIDHPYVGGIIVCDDWGHKSGTMLSPKLLRKLIIPWHERFAGVARAKGKVAVLHCCGKVGAVMPDIIAIGYHAKHSFEDVHTTVESAIERWGKDIAILGGLDVDYLNRSTPDEIYARSRTLITSTRCAGYALGSGNSITSSMSVENIHAMRRAAWEGF